MAEEHTVNPLLECTQGLFALAAELKRGDRGASLGEDFRERVIRACDEMERLGFEARISAQDIRDAKYAVVAYIDEAVMSSEWPGRLEWMAEPLQVSFFGDHLAGEKFYERLAELRQRGEQARDVLEVYFVCLQLGFEGMYRLRGLEQLMALQVDLQAQIDNYQRNLEPRITPGAAPAEGMLQQVRQQVPLWVIPTVTLSLAVLAWLGFQAALAHRAGTSAEQIAALTASLPVHQEEVLP